jgi:P4 family phage/plasmid primase-like protien
MTDLQGLLNKFRNNILRFPNILNILSDDLGVSTESLNLLEVGFYPGHQSWIFPERDSSGNIIGLMERYQDGKKFMLKDSGSKRGLIYIVNQGQTYERYKPGKENWIRVSKENPCPLCGKSDGCLLPVVHPESPGAIVCVHIPQGSVKQLELGYLHILKPETNYSKSQKTLLIPSENPVLVVEGASDVAVATDLGFTAVGSSNAGGGKVLLRKLLEGYDVVIIGENDSGAGIRGMESAFKILKVVCKSVIKLLPPDGIKDLRIWKNKNGLTTNELLEYILKQGDSSSNPDIFEDDVASTIAEVWIHREKTKNSCVTIRNYKGQWTEWNKQCYDNLDTDVFRGQLYNFLSGKKFYKETRNGVAVEPYKPTRAKVNDIIDALSKWCPIVDDPPVWLSKTERPDPVDLIIFKNGMLNVNEYIEGKIRLYNPTPELFTFDALPYNFDENTESSVWDNFLEDIYNGDKTKILLLSQWFGYNCIPDMSFEKLMLFTGRPRSGKSTVLETLQATLGERQCCESSFQSLTNSFGYQPLLGKLAVLIGDAKSPKTGDANAVLEKILHITGGDAVSVNRKGLKELPNVHLKCRFTIAMNDLPAFTDHSRALEPRLNIITFENSYIGKEDRTLKRRLRKEAADGKIINFALRGLKDLREKKDFIMPESSEIALQQFREIASPVISFVNDCCEFPEGVYDKEKFYVPKDQLFDIWKAWCVNQGRQHGFKESFCRWFLATCPQIITTRKRMGNNRIYVFEGIRITGEAFKEYIGG